MDEEFKGPVFKWSICKDNTAAYIIKDNEIWEECQFKHYRTDDYELIPKTKTISENIRQSHALFEGVKYLKDALNVNFISTEDFEVDCKIFKKKLKSLKRDFNSAKACEIKNLISVSNTLGNHFYNTCTFTQVQNEFMVRFWLKYMMFKDRFYYSNRIDKDIYELLPQLMTQEIKRTQIELSEKYEKDVKKMMKKHNSQVSELESDIQNYQARIWKLEEKVRKWKLKHEYDCSKVEEFTKNHDSMKDTIAKQLINIEDLNKRINDLREDSKASLDLMNYKLVHKEKELEDTYQAKMKECDRLCQVKQNILDKGISDNDERRLQLEKEYKELKDKLKEGYKDKNAQLEATYFKNNDNLEIDYKNRIDVIEKELNDKKAQLDNDFKEEINKFEGAFKDKYTLLYTELDEKSLKLETEINNQEKILESKYSKKEKEIDHKISKLKGKIKKEIEDIRSTLKSKNQDTKPEDSLIIQQISRLIILVS